MGDRMRKILMWLLMLTKRLYKKPAFLMLLIAIPLVVLGYGMASREDSGMMTIVLACEDTADALSKRLVEELCESGSVIRFIHTEDPEEGREMVGNGVADAAWIIPKDLQKQISDYAAGIYTGYGFVTVVVREETVPLMLANEKLSAKLFHECARTGFLYYFRENVPEMQEASDETILTYFDSVSFDEGIFAFSYVDSDINNENSMNYLLMPVRGILAVLILIGGIATAMFYVSDDREGLFSWVGLMNKPNVELGYQVISIGNFGFVVLIALTLAGLSVGLFREVVCMLLYIFCCCVFCQLLRLWCGNLRALATVLPVLAVSMLAICPVFISVPALRHVQLLLPPTYYIHSIYNSEYLLYMLLYSLILKFTYELSSRLLRRV